MASLLDSFCFKGLQNFSTMNFECVDYSAQLEQICDNQKITAAKEVIRTRKAFVEALFVLIWETPSFKKQVCLIDEIVRIIDEETERELLLHVINKFETINGDRRDKFYYFMSKSLRLLNFKEILSIKNTDVLDCCCRYLRNNRCIDWDDSLFVEFLAYCKPWLCRHFRDIAVEEGKVRIVLSDDKISQVNREALYRLFSK